MASKPPKSKQKPKLHLKWLLHSPATMLVICLVAVGLWYVQTHPVKTRTVVTQAAAAQRPETKPSQPKKVATPVTASAPAPVTTPPPETPKAVAPSPTPTVQTVVPASKPQPVITPSPQSNVSGLAPVAPSPAPSPANNPSPASTSSSSPPPATAIGYTSTNWSGYMAVHGTFTAISGSWTVPRASGNGTSLSADSTWLGIGGVTNSDLIQIGTQNIISASGQVSTSAFYEVLPDAAQTIPTMNVSAGDIMSANITELTGNQWSLTINDNTNGGSFSTTLAYASSLSSAEWIEEDPSYTSGKQIAFDNFQNTSFSNGLTNFNGTNSSINDSGAQAVVMVNHTGQTIAMPSALTSSGNGFTVTRQNTN